MDSKDKHLLFRLFPESYAKFGRGDSQATSHLTWPTFGSWPFPVSSDLFSPILCLSLSLSITDMIIYSTQTLCWHIPGESKREKVREWDFINRWQMSAHERTNSLKWQQIKSENGSRKESESRPEQCFFFLRWRSCCKSSSAETKERYCPRL